LGVKLVFRKKGQKRGTFYQTRPTAFTTTQMKQFELSLARIYNLSQDFKKSQEMLKTTMIKFFNKTERSLSWKSKKGEPFTAHNRQYSPPQKKQA
jgi:hypothetical protein